MSEIKRSGTSSHLRSENNVPTRNQSVHISVSKNPDDVEILPYMLIIGSVLRMPIESSMSGR